MGQHSDSDSDDAFMTQEAYSDEIVSTSGGKVKKFCKKFFLAIIVLALAALFGLQIWWVTILTDFTLCNGYVFPGQVSCDTWANPSDYSAPAVATEPDSQPAPETNPGEDQPASDTSDPSNDSGRRTPSVPPTPTSFHS